MIPARDPIQRRADAKLLVLRADGTIVHAPRSALPGWVRRGDLVVANDAATLPASLRGLHVPTAEAIEVRLAGRRSLEPDALRRCVAVVFGAGDFRTRTEDRPLPPPLAAGDRLALGPLTAIVERTLGHPRLIALRFEATTAEVWAGVARHGRPTPVAGPPVAFEPPSAGFMLDWRALGALRNRGVAFATLTHAAGISSTGDQALDARLPFDEPYLIPAATVRAIGCAHARGARVIAVGTTVVRALEHAALHGTNVRAGPGLATQRIGAGTPLRVVDAIVSGTHEPGSSHYDLLRAFADDAALRDADAALDAHDYRSHEFGDSVLIERQARHRTGQPLPAHALAA